MPLSELDQIEMGPHGKHHLSNKKRFIKIGSPRTGTISTERPEPATAPGLNMYKARAAGRRMQIDGDARYGVVAAMHNTTTSNGVFLETQRPASGWASARRRARGTTARRETSLRANRPLSAKKITRHFPYETNTYAD
ncbi:hypothetical protein EVAR_37198_1 [Eumeta japonica]|uniref:Uncharacterized protein n=1 Tax=Eumeta variegata TaxID=151549 RepID=A0A4C1Z1G9_EUMVA|nr:hypothetical protein EVAR_37198_1 [Eumeta japonica]